MNTVQLIGNLTRDPELRYTGGSQTPVCRFTLAVNRLVNGEKKADFPQVVVFGKQAENCEKYLERGRKVAVEGRIQTGSYEKENGEKVYTTDVVAHRVEFLEWGDSDKKSGNSKAEQNEVPENFAMIDEDIPF